MAPSKTGQLGNEAEIKEVQKSVLWELTINLPSMHGEEIFLSPGKRSTRRKGLSLCSTPAELWDLSLTSRSLLGGTINAAQSRVPYA